MVTNVKGVDPRVKRTRQLLQQALFEFLQEKSFASITVQDIAERAKVNRATLYAHFEDKYELLESIIREQFQQVVARRRRQAHAPTNHEVSRGVINHARTDASLPPSYTLRVLIRAVFDYLSEVQSQWQPTATQFEPLFEQIVQEELSEALLSWLKQVPAPSTGRRVPVGTMALVMSWAIVGAAVQWSRGTRTISAEQMVNQVLIVLTEGVARLTPGPGTG